MERALSTCHGRDDGEEANWRMVGLLVYGDELIESYD